MNKICIIGGCGHVGIPLGLAFANSGNDVTLLDINTPAVNQINSGKLPFAEKGAAQILHRCLNKNLRATSDKNAVKNADTVIFITGTPVDSKRRPTTKKFIKILKDYAPFLNSKQLIVLRSTVYVGTTRLLGKVLNTNNIAFCPERIAQGNGIEEIATLPQIVSALSPAAQKAAATLFKKIAPKTIFLQPEEAELAKLMTNSWRYIEFGIANQFYQLLEKNGFDFYKILSAIKEDYPRAKHFAGAGLTKGPCLYKDTAQLLAYFGKDFSFGRDALSANENLPKLLSANLKKELGTLKNKNIVILGKTFKADSDDTRDSLSLSLERILKKEKARPFFDDIVLGLKANLAKADGVIVATPHKKYKNIKLDCPVIDCWNFLKKE